MSSNPVKYTGFDHAGSVTPGTVIEDVYYAVPVHGTTGDRYDDLVEALTEALRRAEEAEAKNPGYIPVVSLEVRWVMRDAARRTTTNTPASRLTYGSPAEAREHLARIVQFA